MMPRAGFVGLRCTEDVALISMVLHAAPLTPYDVNSYNEARVKWGMMVNRTRDIVRQFWTYCDDVEINKRATKWTIAFVFTCKESLRWKPECNELLALLGSADVRHVNAADHMPIYAMEKISDCIKDALKGGHIDTQTAYMIDRNITSFEDQIGVSGRHACFRTVHCQLPSPSMLRAQAARELTPTLVSLVRTTTCKASERILKTPVPYGLVLHLRFLIVL
jgi:predicted membrane chloride channel (bestrophin family)